jgi:uncharacterized protein (DUF1501 family)
MLTRRSFLHTAAAFGMLSHQSGLGLASMPGQKRLIVIMLRGGMDGLDVVQPIGDAAHRSLRPANPLGDAEAPIAVDNFYALHAGLASLQPLFLAHEALAVHAVSTPFHSRSHFQAQDLLEWGAKADERHDSGWVNRLIGLLGGKSLGFASEVGASVSQLMNGPEPVLNVYPETDTAFWANSKQFLDVLYQNEPDFAPLLTQLDSLSDTMDKADNIDPGVSTREVAAYVASLMRKDCRLASFSLFGWDTHVGQAPKLTKNLLSLASAMTTLKTELADDWQHTLVMAVSEFGRTARYNGTGGTDHGTGGVALLAGGALANGLGGKVITTKWPGLADDQLFEQRDLKPTDDIRRYIGWAIARHFDLSPQKVSSTLFPGVEMGQILRIV